MRIITGYLLAYIVIISMPHFVFASGIKEIKPIEIIYQQQVHLNVASDAVNRINFDNFRVVKLIGNVSDFTSVLSEQGSDLFIAPRVPSGKKIDFSALLATGDIIDFSLKVVKSTTPYLVKLKFSGETVTQNKSEAAKMIEAMSRGVSGKYYLQKPNKKVNIALIKGIKAVAQSSYRFGNLRGTSLVLENTGRYGWAEITADELARAFEGIVALYIEQGLLAPRGKTKAYIVFKEAVL